MGFCSHMAAYQRQEHASPIQSRKHLPFCATGGGKGAASIISTTQSGNHESSNVQL